jgi:hypothetical protein
MREAGFGLAVQQSFVAILNLSFVSCQRIARNQRKFVIRLGDVSSVTMALSCGRYLPDEVQKESGQRYGDQTERHNNSQWRL